MDIKNILKKVIPIVLGLGITVGAWFYLQSYLENNQEVVSMPVVVRNIPPYTTLTADDITFKEFIKGSEHENSIKNPRDAIGKITTVSLQKNWQINSKVLVTKDTFGNQRRIGVNVDAARSAGVKPGDLVDVYWLTVEKGEWTGETARLVAENVRVLEVCDQYGSILQGNQNSKTTEPRVIYLLIKPEDVEKVIGGSGTDNTSIALAIKRKEDSLATSTTEPNPEETNPGTTTNTGKTS